MTIPICPVHDDVMPNRNETPDSYLTPKQAHDQTGVSTKTLARLAADGVIVSYTLPSGHRRYSLESILQLRGVSS